MINKVILVGRLGRDPELRYTASGQAVVNFSLATDDSWTDKNGERQSRTEWHNIVAWARLAEICQQYLTKGRLVYIEGRIQTREWEDRDGNRRWTTEVVANEMKMLGGRGEDTRPEDMPGENRGVPASRNQEASGGMEVGITDDDIPF